MLVLVGYASAHGSTRQIAERVGSIGSAAAASRSASSRSASLHDLEPYDAVVLGSAIHHGAWLPEATEVVRANAEVLAAKPVWLFSVGMVAALPRRLQGRGTAGGAQGGGRHRAADPPTRATGSSPAPSAGTSCPGAVACSSG